MLYEDLTEKYKEGEPIFFPDTYHGDKSISGLTTTWCKKGLLIKYDNGIYYLPKKTRLKSSHM